MVEYAKRVLAVPAKQLTAVAYDARAAAQRRKARLPRQAAQCRPSSSTTTDRIACGR
uniref:Uncharacterized protein n=1 Tax=Ralstonia solanacearum TaxID=305 RepID=A0A0S4WJL5_RALSL|nr:protein of unknown function [Ralstonia solanacearum]